MAFAEVEKFLDTPVKRYSSGMYVRLAFAVAAHLEPEILIVDEVLAVGDAEFQKKCLGKMGEVASGGRTVLFVSHNMAAIQNLCQQAIVLSSGRLALSADPTSAISSYLSERTIDLSDLSSLPRPKWAHRWIRQAQLLDSDGRERNTFLLGEQIVIEMSFWDTEGRSIRQPGMGVVVNHLARGPVGCINTRMSGYEAKAGDCTSGVFRATIEAPFVQGMYSVDLWLDDGHSDLDVVNDAFRFSVQNADIYGSGFAPYDDVGVIYMKCSWSFIQESDQPAESAL